MFHDHVKFSGALNQEFEVSVTLCVRRKFTLKYKNANSTSKLPDATFFLCLGRSYYQCVLNLNLLFFLPIFLTGLFAGFAHIRCLTVAIRWNKETGFPIILSFLSHKTLYSVLDALNSWWHSSVRYCFGLTFPQYVRVHLQQSNYGWTYFCCLTFITITKTWKYSLLNRI